MQPCSRTACATAASSGSRSIMHTARARFSIASMRSSPTQPSRPSTEIPKLRDARQSARAELFARGSDVRDGQVPVGEQYFKALLFLPFVGFLIRPKLLDQRFFVRVGRCRDRRILVADCDAVIPSSVFGHVIGGRFDSYRKDAPALSLFPQQRIVVLQEEL